MSTILTCTDGSRYARSVYDHTAWAARRLGADVHVLHVVEESRHVAPMADLSGAIGVEAMQQLTAEIAALEAARARVAQKHAGAILADAQQHLAGAGLERVEVEAVGGELLECITRREAQAELIVVGKRGENANLAKLHLGGNLPRVIRSARGPVLVASRDFTPIERFLIAYDGSPSVLKAVEYLLTSPLLKGLHGHLVRAGKLNEAAPGDLEETAVKLRAAGYSITAQATAGTPEHVIGAALTEQRAQLLVMGAFGHSRIREFLLGSTTSAMVRSCLVPVLMFR